MDSWMHAGDARPWGQKQSSLLFGTIAVARVLTFFVVVPQSQFPQEDANIFG